MSPIRTETRTQGAAPHTTDHGHPDCRHDADGEYTRVIERRRVSLFHDLCFRSSVLALTPPAPPGHPPLPSRAHARGELSNGTSSQSHPPFRQDSDGKKTASHGTQTQHTSPSSTQHHTRGLSACSVGYDLGTNRSRTRVQKSRCAGASGVSCSAVRILGPSRRPAARHTRQAWHRGANGPFEARRGVCREGRVRT